MRDRTITISGASKSFSATGWRIGWAVAERRLTAALRAAHDLLSAGASHPLQIGVIAALELPATHHESLVDEYRMRRDCLVGGLRARVCRPRAGGLVLRA